MIDNKIIAKTVDSIQKSLDNATVINNQLSLLNNVLPIEAIDKLQLLVNDPTVDWKTVPHQTYLNRRAINWITESIIEELHIVGNTLTETIKNYYNINDIKFQALQLWKDGTGYAMGKHEDNPVIDVAIQLYLFENRKTEGTTFFINDTTIDVPFEKNTAYMLWKKSNKERIPHQPTSNISADGRYSLYLTWSRFGKQAPDANDPAAFR